jgi:hypothetical protein
MTEAQATFHESTNSTYRTATLEVSLVFLTLPTTKQTTRDYGRVGGKKGKSETMHVMHLTNANDNIVGPHVTTMATPNVAFQRWAHWQRVLTSVEVVDALKMKTSRLDSKNPYHK